tara:strand:+ start:3188 stop:3340 length:153 start_codon:yes stop_codon:yes gene_type:complete
MSEYREDWRDIAKASEKDPKVMEILTNGPKSLSQAYLLGAMRYKYGRKGN